MNNNFTKLYSGSVINAEFISSVLEENGIPSLIRNFQEESLAAGWAASATNGEASVYVHAKDYFDALDIIRVVSVSEMAV